MKAVLLLALIVASAFAGEFDSIVNTVNSHPNALWKAAAPSRFKNIKDAKQLCGRLPRIHPKLPAKQPLLGRGFRALPTAFDSRTQWGSICPSILEIRDQSSCGSCWAFSASEVATDRTCIASHGSVKVDLAAADFMSCCSECGDGCNGGWEDTALDYWVKTGIVSGGLYHANSTCFPYPFAPCDHHTTGQYQPCTGDFDAPACPNKCVNGINWTKDKHFGASSYSLDGEENIMSDILNHGPVTAAFNVYEDFLTYKSGVYHHVTGSSLGGHAIKIIGWGVDAASSTKYWIVANSWNEDWGNKGTFWIKRGTNECDIEGDVSGGLAKF